MNMSMKKWLSFLSKHGKVEAERKALKRNWKAARSVMTMYAREGNWHAYYHGFIYEENLKRLAAEGFKLKKQRNELSRSIYWAISWEDIE